MYIYSKWSEKDMLQLGATNGVADLYELLGIYISYCNDSSVQDFDEYYTNTVGKSPYHFRNIAERSIKQRLLMQGNDIPRRDFRLLSRTYKNLPVMASSKMGTIFSELTDQIYNVDVTEKALRHMDAEFTPQRTLYFQHWLVSSYVSERRGSPRKVNRFNDVLVEWENNRIFL